MNDEQQERDLFVRIVREEDVLEEEDNLVVEVVLVSEVDNLEYLLDGLGFVGLVDAVDELVDVLHKVHFSELLLTFHVLEVETEELVEDGEDHYLKVLDVGVLVVDLVVTQFIGGYDVL